MIYAMYPKKENLSYLPMTQIYSLQLAGNSRQEVYYLANEILSSISMYMKCNLLHVNAKKSCYLYFNPNKRENDLIVNEDLSNLNLAIDGTVLRRVKTAKFLGVLMDDELSWKPHIKALNCKLKSACGRIYRIKNCLPPQLYKQIYNTLFESHIRNFCLGWCIPQNH